MAAEAFNGGGATNAEKGAWDIGKKGLPSFLNVPDIK
jgi:hypothetical protein